jgi:hypothetical protein
VNGLRVKSVAGVCLHEGPRPISIADQATQIVKGCVDERMG